MLVSPGISLRSNIREVAGSWSRFKKIGLFDSGVGGLSVLRSFLARSEAGGKEFIYIGDTLRCPYGDRPEDEVALYVSQLACWLLQQEIDLLVMACNTSAALVKNKIQSLCSVPVLDLLESTAEAVARQNFSRVGVIATAATARRKAFTRAINSHSPQTEVFELGCPLLVPVVEAGLANGPEGLSSLRPYVSQLLEYEVDAIIYGCTHYPFLESSLRAVLQELSDKPVFIIDPAEALMTELFMKKPSHLSMHVVERFTTRIVTTGDAGNFSRIAARCLGYELSETNNISIKELQSAMAWQTSNAAQRVITSQVSPGAVS